MFNLLSNCIFRAVVNRWMLVKNQMMLRKTKMPTATLIFPNRSSCPTEARVPELLHTWQYREDFPKNLSHSWAMFRAWAADVLIFKSFESKHHLIWSSRNFTPFSISQLNGDHLLDQKHKHGSFSEWRRQPNDTAGLGESRVHWNYYWQHQEDCRFLKFIW